MPAKNQYHIIRDDLPIDPLTIISDGLLIGRLSQCELMLNHPSVSRVQAGIKQFENNYYLFPYGRRTQSYSTANRLKKTKRSPPATSSKLDHSTCDRLR